MQPGPKWTSDALGWAGIHISHWADVPSMGDDEIVLDGHLIVVHQTPQPVRTQETINGKFVEGVSYPGDINVLSAGVTSSCVWDKPLTFTQIRIAPNFAQSLAGQIGVNPDAVELANQYRLKDAALLNVARMMLSEVEQGGLNGSLYSDSLSTVLLTHLLRNHIARPVEVQPGTRHQARREISHAIDYVLANLHENISLDDLSRVANLSPFHLARVFKQHTGLSPHQFVIQQRIESAKQRLRQPNATIGDVASAVGFADQAHFSRHFKALVGVTPKAFQIGA